MACFQLRWPSVFVPPPLFEARRLSGGHPLTVGSGRKLALDFYLPIYAQIRGAIVIYLNITLLFATLDTLLVTLVPGAYTNLPQDLSKTIGAMVYFSLTTITTIGYGDILPVHAFARSLATLEAVIGQFYVGILIATLVGLHVSHRQSKDRSLKKP